jgi:hypothetical protein
MKLQTKREALEKMNRQASEMPLDSGLVEVFAAVLAQSAQKPWIGVAATLRSAFEADVVEIEPDGSSQGASRRNTASHSVYVIKVEHESDSDHRRDRNTAQTM